jgi:AraC family transcriptional regulator
MLNGRIRRKRKTKTRRSRMEPKIVTKPTFTVVGMKYRGKNEKNEIPQLWEKFMPRAGEIKQRANPFGYGVMDNYDEKTGEFDYLAGVEVQNVSDAPEGMESWQVPEQTYAAFPCNLKNIKETFQQIYHEWLPQSGYQRTDGPEFEYYDESFRPDQGKLDLFIYIPVRKK